MCGFNQTSQRKAQEYYDAIHEVGHNAILFTRGKFDFGRPHIVCPSKDSMLDEAKKSDAEFFMACTDSLVGIVGLLNQQRNKPFFPSDNILKSNLGNLKHNIPLIQTWENLDDVPNDIPIFIKPNNGAGGIANTTDDLPSEGDPWTYKRFSSKDHFVNFIKDKGGLKRFFHSQMNPGSLGKYVIQEYIDHEEFVNYNYLNDGVSQHFSYIVFKRDRKSHKYTWVVDYNDEWDFAQNGPWGTFYMMQVLMSPQGPKINDFNLRCSALIPIFYKLVCPSFYSTYFNNLLNNRQEKYDWKVGSWSIIPHHEFNLYDNIQFLPAYDFYDYKQEVFGIVLHD